MTDTPTKAATKAARYGKPRAKVPPFARYEGTSAWRHNKTRVKAYYRYLAEKQTTTHA